ncbi:hypothetical protein EBU71_04030 [bacterium]|nr:hypothetical protein [Candidatus Elulimicrobium humile]
MPIFNFNSSRNSLNLFGNSRGILPRVGINFGNSRIARGVGSFLFSGGNYRKGHPGSNGQVVGQGVRNLRNLFQGALNPFSSGSIDAISEKKWNYESLADRKHPAGFTPPYAFYQNATGLFAKKWRPFKKIGIEDRVPKEKGWLPLVDFVDRENKNSILAINNSFDYRKDILGQRDPSTERFSFNLNDNGPTLELSENFSEISDSGQELFGGLQVPGAKSISLTSWTHTLDDNEDPTLLGFDIVIDELTSPLFNGACRKFLLRFGNGERRPPLLQGDPITELQSRIEILDEFIAQFKKFFKMNLTAGASETQKSHYLTQLRGSHKFGFIKTPASGETGPKIFTDFPTEKVSIKINEDVTQNIAYLSYLYNILSHSRIQGRRLIPQNLLRFNCRIIISEIRNYNRVMETVTNLAGTINTQDPTRTARQQLRQARREFISQFNEFSDNFGLPQFNTKESIIDQEKRYIVLSDLISKMEYNLYECEFDFSRLTHGENISLDSTITAASYELSFDYKFVSSEFHKFKFLGPREDPKDSFSFTRYNDQYINPKKISSLDTNVARLNLNDQGITFSRSNITFQNPKAEVYTFDAYPKDGYPLGRKNRGILGNQRLKNLANTFLGGLVRNLVGDVGRAAANAVNAEVGKRFNLVNKTITERLDRLGLSATRKGIDDPRNVYDPRNIPGNTRFNLGNQVRNAIRGFVGRSVGVFFTRPLNTAEANNGYLPTRGGGGFTRRSIYRPVATRIVSRIRGRGVGNPRNIYVRRRVGSFLSNANPREVRAANLQQQLPRSNPFVQNISSSSTSSGPSL